MGPVERRRQRSARARRLRDAVVLLLVLSSSACRREPPPVAKPRLSLAELRHDFGHVRQGDVLGASLAVTNAGTAPLTIARVVAGRVCSGTVEPSVIAPAATAALRVQCAADKHGAFHDVLLVESNDPATPHRIVLSGDVMPLLALVPPFVDFNLRWHEDATRTVHVIGARVTDARVTLRDLGDPGLSVDIRSGGGEGTVLEVRFKGAAPGRRTGNLVFATGLDRPGQLLLPFSCVVHGTLEVSPANVYFDLREPSPKRRVIEVQSSQAGFRVRTVSVIAGPFSAAIEHPGSGPARIVVTLLDEQLAPGAQSAVGTLLVVSNDRSEPRREVPLLAYGKLQRAGASQPVDAGAP